MDDTTAADRVRLQADETPNALWLTLLAEAMEDHVAGEPITITGYMADRVRKVAEHLAAETKRCDELTVALSEAVSTNLPPESDDFEPEATDEPWCPNCTCTSCMEVFDDDHDD